MAVIDLLGGVKFINGATPEVQKPVDQVGKGVGGQNNQLPVVVPVVRNTYDLIFDSLEAFMPNISGDDLDVMILSATVKLKLTQSEGDQSRIEIDISVKRTM